MRMATQGFEKENAAILMWCRLHLVETATVAPATRSAASPTSFDGEAYANAHLLTVRFADGSEYFTDPASFAVRYAAQESLRSAGPGRVTLPRTLAAARLRGTNGGEDGVGAVERYTLTRLEQASTLDRVYEIGHHIEKILTRWWPGTPPGASKLAMQLCTLHENSVLQRRQGGDVGGMLQWSQEAGDWAYVKALKEPEAAAASGPACLLLLHGTASSTRGSFGALWQTARDDPSKPFTFARVARRYESVLAFEHRTLTLSPVENALELLEVLRSLPRGTRIDLVSHSRGGLVGELLCLLNLEGSDAAWEAAQRAFEEEYGEHRKKPFSNVRTEHPDKALIAPLFAALRALARRGVQVGTFVRVACPARGTLLADGRTDLFVSLLTRAVGLAFGGAGNPVFEMFAGLARGLVAARADAKVLPGLEAMIPGSPLTRALNLHGLRVSGRLRVIAGDSQGKGWGGLVTLIGDVFYGLHDHDFVVHTRSMFGGLKRQTETESLAGIQSPDAPMSLRVQGPAVNHFSYFSEGESRGALFVALTRGDQGFARMADDEARTRGAQDDAPGQAPLARASQEDWFKRIDRPGDKQADRPVLVVIPGWMGSELANTQGRVWLSTSALFGGGARELDLRSRQTLRPSGLLPVAYERLLRRARERFDVVTLPYDWRQPIEAAAAELVELLQGLIEVTGRRAVPVHVIAHSTGGLVARWALFHDAAGQALWAGGLRDRRSRLLMLGTPNHGLHAPVRLLLQQHPLCTMLESFAQAATRRDVAKWCARFPGVLELLPTAIEERYGDLFTNEAWRYIVRDDPDAQTPEPATLAAAATFAGALHRHWPDLRDDPNVLYVAGQGWTDVGLAAPDDPARAPGGTGRLRFRQSLRGDGAVPWSAAPDERRTWYLGVEHAALADTPSAFDAYFELLERGTTDKLRQNPAEPRGAVADWPTRVWVAEQHARLPASMPEDDDAASWVLGLQPPGALPAGAVLDKIDVSIAYGSLDYARFPLIVGHYLNDRIVSAEQRVDEKLNGQLTQLQQLNLYPGARNTSAYVRPNDRDESRPAYPGAIIVGLGNVGELTSASLAETVARAILRYAFEHRHRDPFVPNDQPEDIRLSTLLVGSHSQAVTMRESLTGVLEGVWRAAKVLSHTPAMKDLVRIRELEVVEMWEYRALEAAYGLKQLLVRTEWQARFHWPRPLLDKRDGGLAGYAIQADRDWWQRLIIKRNDVGGLSYALVADQARVEATHVQSDVEGMASFMDAISDGAAETGFDSPQMSRALYEMLLPTDLKPRIANFDNTVLVVDDKSASYPWELLAPPRPPEDVGDDESPKPLAVQAGLIRQRLTDDFRRLPRISSEFGVLIVGSPDTRGWKDQEGKDLVFDRLPAAEREAQRVAEMLETDPRDWQVSKLIGPDCSFDTVRLQLLAKPYRLLHLCGHGVIDQWLRFEDVAGTQVPVLKTGMLLSGRQVLGAGDVEQMSSVPELVFINCCYSGREGSASRGAARRYPVLASSLALKFIQMGAKAVVAAGWRVADDAALAFAECFYSEMLRGMRFGEAVREARSRVYERYGDTTNTWGAYQCYGDHGWTLDARRRRTRFAGSSHLARAHEAMSERELTQQIDRVVAVAGDKPQVALLQQLHQLVMRIEADPLRAQWLRTSTGVRAALGEAFRELGDHRNAIRWFQRAAGSAYSRLQLRQVELLANSLTRLDLASGAPQRAEALVTWLAGAPSSLRSGLPETAGSELCAISGSVFLHNAIELERRRVGTAGTGNRGAIERAQVARLKSAAREFAKAWFGKTVLDDFPDRRAYALSNLLLAAALAVLCEAPTVHAQPAAMRKLLLDCQAEIETVRSGLLEPEMDDLAHQDARDLLERRTRLGERRQVKLDRRSPGRYWLKEADQRMQELRDIVPTTFWDYSNRVDLAVARCLFGEMAQVANTVEQIDIARETRRLLQGALIRWPSPRELESLRARFGLVRQMVTRHKDRFHTPERQAKLASFTEWALEQFERHRPGE
jgi:hypothetical protein